MAVCFSRDKHLNRYNSVLANFFSSKFYNRKMKLDKFPKKINVFRFFYQKEFVSRIFTWEEKSIKVLFNVFKNNKNFKTLYNIYNLNFVEILLLLCEVFCTKFWKVQK